MGRPVALGGTAEWNRRGRGCAWDDPGVAQSRAGITIRAATPGDTEAILEVVEPVIRAGETYAVERDLPLAEMENWWFGPDHEVRVADHFGLVVGSYYLKANQRGPGAHVANCGYITARGMEGQGVARTMCLDSVDRARERGFRAMQFNLVSASNDRAVRLWTSLGFVAVGRIPEAFQLPSGQFCDAFVMHRSL
jgi:ribosomal protein S18 acetylase RimI-like enzyme